MGLAYLVEGDRVKHRRHVDEDIDRLEFFPEGGNGARHIRAVGDVGARYPGLDALALRFSGGLLRLIPGMEVGDNQVDALVRQRPGDGPADPFSSRDPRRFMLKTVGVFLKK